MLKWLWIVKLAKRGDPRSERVSGKNARFSYWHASKWWWLFYSAVPHNQQAIGVRNCEYEYIGSSNWIGLADDEFTFKLVCCEKLNHQTKTNRHQPRVQPKCKYKPKLVHSKLFSSNILVQKPFYHIVGEMDAIFSITPHLKFVVHCSFSGHLF